MLKRVYLDFAENRETGKNDINRREEKELSCSRRRGKTQEIRHLTDSRPCQDDCAR
jgi:hypothetical protein